MITSKCYHRSIFITFCGNCLGLTAIFTPRVQTPRNVSKQLCPWFSYGLDFSLHSEFILFFMCFPKSSQALSPRETKFCYSSFPYNYFVKISCRFRPHARAAYFTWTIFRACPALFLSFIFVTSVRRLTLFLIFLGLFHSGRHSKTASAFLPYLLLTLTHSQR